MSLTFFLTIFHLIGFAIGLGGATASDFLFFRSLKDKKISSDELNLLKTLSRLMWVGLAILFLSGSGFLINYKLTLGSIPLLSDPRFLTKLTIVLVIFLNGLIFHIFIIPFLKKMADQRFTTATIGSKIYLFSASGAISIVSWYSVFILAMLKGVSLPYVLWLSIYLTLTVGAIIGAYISMSFTIKEEEAPQLGIHSKTHKFKVFIGLIFALIIIIAGVLGFSPRGQTYFVCINEAPPWFRPDVLKIKKGDTVVWHHCDEEEGGEYGDDSHTRIFVKEILAHGEEGEESEGEKQVTHTHPIYSISGPEVFNSNFRPVGHLEDGNEFTFKFSKKGIYEYICPTHPYMKGIIAVGVQPEKDSLWPPQEIIKPSLLPPPSISGVGEIWVDTQFEKVSGRKYPGTITVINAETWEIKEVISDSDFNNPHNLWNSPDGKYIFQTQWHSNGFSKINAETKEVIKTVSLGNAPAHVFVHPKKDRIYVTINNESRVVVLDKDLNYIKNIETSFGPHGIWIDPAGKWMSIAAALEEKLNIIDLETEEVVATFEAPGLPLAATVTNDGRYAMISLLLEGKVRFIDLETLSFVKDVKVGSLPIWPSPGPNNKYVFVPNSGSADISVISLDTLEVVKTLPAASGTHGIIFGPKKTTGFYGYFTNKFARVVGIIDVERLETVGYIQLGEGQWGGNGILTLPNAYDQFIR